MRDVLNALGMLKEYYAEHLGIKNVEQLTFGFECAGIITALGEGVREWQIGDEVMATMVHNGLSSYLTLPSSLVIAKPKQMSFEQAATLPLSFFTAYYGLHQLAHIQQGDKVLIHAAAGGVGQAAVQIAQSAGAEIFATASAPKWTYLQSMGIKNIMNSRTLDFAEEIKELTRGKGVDIVFNSLNGEFIDKSIDVLATGGRFIEIGKIGIWTPQQVEAKRADVQYFPFDLGEVAQAQLSLISSIGEQLSQQWVEGNLKPLPYKAFPGAQIQEAFRYLQQAKQIGKVVVTMPEVSSASAEGLSIVADGSYLITGGMGALGLEVASWLVSQGARNLVLMGRKQPSSTAQERIKELETAGAIVQIINGDISNREDVARVIQQFEADIPSGLPHSKA